LPRAVTAIVDIRTGKMYYGESGGLRGRVQNPKLKEYLPKENQGTNWAIDNCAECDALNSALNDNVPPEAMEMHTLKISKSGKIENFETCPNCKVTTSQVKEVTSDPKK
jgi:hypothetical protein